MKELTLGRTPLDGAEETYTMLSKIPSLTTLSLAGSESSVLPEGASLVSVLIVG